MSYEILILKARSALNKKYIDKSLFYLAKEVNEIIKNLRSKASIVYKDFCIFDDFLKSLKRFYLKSESEKRLKDYSEYYSSNNTFNPCLQKHFASKLIQKRTFKKKRVAEMFEKKQNVDVKKKCDFRLLLKNLNSKKVFLTHVNESDPSSFLSSNPKIFDSYEKNYRPTDSFTSGEVYNAYSHLKSTLTINLSKMEPYKQRELSIPSLISELQDLAESDIPNRANIIEDRKFRYEEELKEGLKISNHNKNRLFVKKYLSDKLGFEINSINARSSFMNNANKINKKKSPELIFENKYEITTSHNILVQSKVKRYVQASNEDFKKKGTSVKNSKEASKITIRNIANKKEMLKTNQNENLQKKIKQENNEKTFIYKHSTTVLNKKTNTIPVLNVKRYKTERRETKGNCHSPENFPATSRLDLSSPSRSQFLFKTLRMTSTPKNFLFLKGKQNNRILKIKEKIQNLSDKRLASIDTKKNFWEKFTQSSNVKNSPRTLSMFASNSKEEVINNISKFDKSKKSKKITHGSPLFSTYKILN